MMKSMFNNHRTPFFKHILPLLVVALFLGCTKKPASEIHPEVQRLYDQSIALLNTNPDSSYQVAEKLLELATDLDDGFGIAQSHFIMGWLLRQEENFEPALIHYLQGIKAAEEYDFEDKLYVLWSVTTSVGGIVQYFKEFDLAEKYQLKGLQIANSSGFFSEKNTNEYNLALIMKNQGKYEEAIAVLKNQVKILDKNSKKSFRRLQELQRCYLGMTLLDSACIVSRKILAGDYIEYFGGASLNMARVFCLKDEYDSAKKYFDLSLAFYQGPSSFSFVGFTSAAISYSKFCLEKSELEKAEKILLDATMISDTINPDLKTDENYFEIYHLLSSIYEVKGNFEKATFYETLYRQELNAYTKLHQKYDFNKIVEDFYNNLEEEKRSKEIKNYAYLGSLSLLLLLGGVFGATQYRTYRTRKKLDQTTTEKRLAELKALKAQINPHFLFNALNSIQSYILEDKHDVAESYLVKYGKLMRKILDHSDELTVTLQEELEALKLYVELEQIRVNGGFEFHVSLDESLDPYTTYVPSMVIQPFLENAIWHGVSKMVGKGVVTLDILQKEGWIEVVVTDNGVGYDMKTPTNSASKGVNLVRERLELLEKTEGLTAVADMKSEVGVGMKVILRFSKDLK